MSDMPMQPDDGRGCVSELELDRLLTGDTELALRRRVDACAHCRRRLAELETARQEQMTPFHVARQTAGILARLAAERPHPIWRRHGWRLWAMGTPLPVLAAAALLLFVWPRAPAHAPAPDVIRLKGGAGLEVVLADPPPQRILADGEAVPAGATLSFRAACPQGCFVALFAVDASGVQPIADLAPPPWRIAGPEPEPLPVSVTVDGEPGDDLIVGFFCAAPRAVAQLQAALEAAQGTAPAADLRGAAMLPAVAGCDARSHLVRRGRFAP